VIKGRPAVPSDGIVWITGASSGIGRALALTLADRGFQVAVSARTGAELDRLAAERPGLIHAFPVDVTDEAAMLATGQALRARFGAVGLAVANAGLYLPTDGCLIADQTDAYRRSLDVNIMGTVHMLAACVPHMVTIRRGQIAVMASVTGYGGLPTSAAYGATKAALINMVESLWFDLTPQGIVLSVINPGFIDTPATADNPFPMPFLMPVDKAAARLAEGLARGTYEITFPRRFTYLLKLINLLPRRLYLSLTARATRRG